MFFIFPILHLASFSVCSFLLFKNMRLFTSCLFYVFYLSYSSSSFFLCMLYFSSEMWGFSYHVFFVFFIFPIRHLACFSVSIHFFSSEMGSFSCLVFFAYFIFPILHLARFSVYAIATFLFFWHVRHFTSCLFHLPYSSS